MKALALPQSLLDCLAPNRGAVTIKAAAELIAEEMKALPGNEYERFRIDINLESGFVMIVGRGK